MGFRTKCSAVFLGVSLMMAGSTAFAEVCDYRPSQLIGGAATTAAVAAGGATAAAGTAANIAGYYTLVHATSGATMLASTAAGASAAGTVGIIGGTGAGIGAAAAVITAPATIIAAAVVAVGTGTLEGVCYFKDERITDYDEVAKRLDLLAQSNPKDVELRNRWWGPESSELRLTTQTGIETYRIKNLYIVNGILMHRDWGKNTTIGKLAFIVPTQDGEGLQQPSPPHPLPHLPTRPAETLWRSP